MTDQELSAFVSDGFDRAKAGDALNVFAQTAPYHDNGQLALRSHYAFAWIIYYAMHQTPDADIISRKKMLARYLRLQVAKPHKLHSMILTEAVRLYKDSQTAQFNCQGKPGADIVFSLVKFAEFWDLANLRPGDWRRKEFEGKQLSSTVEKFITLYVDEIEATGQRPSAAFIAVIEEAMKQYADSFNLLDQRATLHILAGEHAAAGSLLRKALLFAPGKFYLWSKLASTVPVEENPRLHVALLYKAMNSKGPDRFKGKVRLSMAKALIELKTFGEAKWELDRFRSTYESNGWHLSPTYVKLTESLPQPLEARDPESLYRKIEHLADSTVYDILPAIGAVKSFHKEPKPGDTRGSSFGRPEVAWRATDREGKNYWFQPGRFGIDPALPSGTALSLRLHEGKVVKAELAAEA